MENDAQASEKQVKLPESPAFQAKVAEIREIMNLVRKIGSERSNDEILAMHGVKPPETDKTVPFYRKISRDLAEWSQLEILADTVLDIYAKHATNKQEVLDMHVAMMRQMVEAAKYFPDVLQFVDDLHSDYLRRHRAAALRYTRLAVIRETSSPLVAWWGFVQAGHELDENKPIEDKQIVLHFSGNGAGMMVNAKQLRDFAVALDFIPGEE